MRHTNFTNASGLHHPDQKTTAVDLAKLAVAIKKDFPQYYPFFSKTSFHYRGREVRGHNKLTANYPGAEGLKTGFVNASGCNLITTATRGDKNLVGVVIGGKTAVARDQKMTKLLDECFGVNKIKRDNQIAQAKVTKTKILSNSQKTKPKKANKTKGNSNKSYKKEK